MSGQDANGGHVQMLLGVYILGGLSEHEAALVRAHLDVCALCRVEHDDLACIPPLLDLLAEEGEMGRLRVVPDAVAVVGESAVVPDEVGGVGESAVVPDEVGGAEAPAAVTDEDAQSAANGGVGESAAGGRLELAAARRAARRARIVAVAAAAVALVAAGAAGWAVSSRASARAVQDAAQLHAYARSASTGVSAEVSLSPAGWGTQIQIVLKHLPPYQSCTLIVLGPHGARETAASWHNLIQTTADIPGAVSFTTHQVVRLEVVTTADRTLVSVPVG